MDPRNRKWLRIVLLVAFFVGVWIIGVATGFTDQLTKEGLRSMILDAGTWGVLLFVGLFCLGLFLQVPGFVFVGGAVLVYGFWLGLLMSIAGGLVAISVSFFVARGIGGDPLSKLKSPLARKIISKLNERPVRTMCFLRVFMQMSPALNVALALSGVRYRDYIAGAAMGMWAPVSVMAIVWYFVLNGG